MDEAASPELRDPPTMDPPAIFKTTQKRRLSQEEKSLIQKKREEAAALREKRRSLSLSSHPVSLNKDQKILVLKKREEAVKLREKRRSLSTSSMHITPKIATKTSPKTSHNPVPTTNTVKNVKNATKTSPKPAPITSTVKNAKNETPATQRGHNIAGVAADQHDIDVRNKAKYAKICADAVAAIEGELAVEALLKDEAAEEQARPGMKKLNTEKP